MTMAGKAWQAMVRVPMYSFYRGRGCGGATCVNRRASNRLSRFTSALSNSRATQNVTLGGIKFQVQRVHDGAIAQRLPGASQSRDIFVARVEAMRDGVQLVLRVPRQVGALRQILTQEPIGVFIGPALPAARDPDLLCRSVQPLAARDQ